MCYCLNLFNALFCVNIYRLFSLTMKSKCTVAGCGIQTPHSKKRMLLHLGTRNQTSKTFLKVVTNEKGEAVGEVLTIIC